MKRCLQWSAWIAPSPWLRAVVTGTLLAVIFDFMSSLWEKARQWIPGGVNSPVRAFASVGLPPLFIDRSEGSRLWDTTGKEYIDYVGSWGPMILGHNHPAVREAIIRAAEKGASFGTCTEREVELAETICRQMESMEMVRLVNSGTEATMSALRLARGYTGRDRFIKFRGCYHGHGDSFLIEAGSGALTHGQPSSPGVTKGTAADTLLADFNDLETVKQLFEAHPDQIACIIVEPVAGNMGVVPPEPGFLQGLRSLCDTHKALLIFDEVMTGFRLGPQGAQGIYGIRPDLTTLGKIIGGGLPVGAYGGRREIMQRLSPAGPVYQAGTLSGNPLATAAGLATLKELGKEGFYPNLEKKAQLWEQGLGTALEECSFPRTLQRVGSMLTLFFHKGPVRDYKDAAASDTALFAKWFQALLNRGVFVAPSQFEASFLSAAHSEGVEGDLDRTMEAARQAVSQLNPNP